ncbi:hypothetical protein [Paenibacillus silviterrae]|uniref:hypothetical protein n=1 Tax=Paenibacillus silviterrae TaxID=3242194 RepID=UPI002543A4AD|nr:hypothetical protein [Paenibacillus chinjuensis]
MIGSIRINFIVGAVAFFLTFLLSMTSNVWTTTLLRSVYSFIIVFLIVFLCRYVLGTVAGMGHLPAGAEEQPDEQHKGKAFDAVTPPDEDEVLHQMLRDQASPKDQEESVFTPLNPPKLSTKTNMEPEELAQALRRMSEE